MFNVITVVIGTKRSSHFNNNDWIPFHEKHDIVYWSVFAIKNYLVDYVGEGIRRLQQHGKVHNGYDYLSRRVKNAVETVHLPVPNDNFVNGSEYCNNTRKKNHSLHCWRNWNHH